MISFSDYNKILTETMEDEVPSWRYRDPKQMDQKTLTYDFYFFYAMYGHMPDHINDVVGRGYGQNITPAAFDRVMYIYEDTFKRITDYQFWWVTEGFFLAIMSEFKHAIKQFGRDDMIAYAIDHGYKYRGKSGKMIIEELIDIVETDGRSGSQGQAPIKASSSDRQWMYTHMIKNGYERLPFLRSFLNIFIHSTTQKHWHSGFGGVAWDKAIKGLYRVLTAKPRNTWEKAVLLDTIYSIQHNNGLILNKTKDYDYADSWLTPYQDMKRSETPGAMMEFLIVTMKHMSIPQRVYKWFFYIAKIDDPVNKPSFDYMFGGPDTDDDLTLGNKIGKYRGASPLAKYTASDFTVRSGYLEWKTLLGPDQKKVMPIFMDLLKTGELHDVKLVNGIDFWLFHPQFREYSMDMIKILLDPNNYPEVNHWPYKDVYNAVRMSMWSALQLLNVASVKSLASNPELFDLVLDMTLFQMSDISENAYGIITDKFEYLLAVRPRLFEEFDRRGLLKYNQAMTNNKESILDIVTSNFQHAAARAVKPRYIYRHLILGLKKYFPEALRANSPPFALNTAYAPLLEIKNSFLSDFDTSLIPKEMDTSLVIRAISKVFVSRPTLGRFDEAMKNTNFYWRLDKAYFPVILSDATQMRKVEYDSKGEPKDSISNNYHYRLMQIAHQKGVTFEDLSREGDQDVLAVHAYMKERGYIS